MTIGKGWLTLLVVLIAIAVLAPDSQFGGAIRDTFSQLRGSASTLMDTIGSGSQELGGFAAE